jgi:hypothetical protein
MNWIKKAETEDERRKRRMAVTKARQEIHQYVVHGTTYKKVKGEWLDECNREPQELKSSDVKYMASLLEALGSKTPVKQIRRVNSFPGKPISLLSNCSGIRVRKR